MGVLSFGEKQTIYRLFDISDGYIFKFLSDRGEYNKNKTHDLILDSCGIDIYKDRDYSNLSQQKCVEKIWNKSNPQVVANLLAGLSDYFRFAMGSDYWSEEDIDDFHQVQTIITRLRSTNMFSLPAQESADLKLIFSDIEANINADKPELVIDRLHTFASEYIRKICQKHGISISDDKGDNYSLDSLVGRLKRWYEKENYFESEFCTVAIKNTINIFAKYNDLRNKKSAAHPNPLLKKAEAEYAVKIIADTLMFIDRIEESKQKESPPRDNIVINVDTEELPF